MFVRPDAPQTGTPAPSEAGRHSGDITSLAWNTKVTHILASSDNKGVCIIWDLRNKKPWGQVRDPNRSIYSAVAWNPSEGMHFLTATDDDMRPVIRLYDLRSSMSTPLAELHGHTQGIDIYLLSFSVY
jgi:protein transport protein SEC31